MNGVHLHFLSLTKNVSFCVEKKQRTLRSRILHLNGIKALCCLTLARITFIPIVQTDLAELLF